MTARLVCLAIGVVACSALADMWADKSEGRVTVEPLGAMRARIERNFNRLEETKYHPDKVFLSDAESHGWPGDTEGRTILGLVLEARATGREPRHLAEILRRLPSKLNEKGYMGAVLPDGKVDEQQISGNGWLLRGLCEYYLWKRDPATKEMIRTLARGLFLPAKGRFAQYPIDPKQRQKDVGAAAGERLAEVDGWILSSDIGCFAIGLDGLVQAWDVTEDPDLAPVINEMVARFLEIDLVGIRAQTHATLTGLRALMRLSRGGSAVESVSCVQDVAERFALYQRYGMTEYFENVNWFKRYDTWTEPCAIVDAYLLAIQLWRESECWGGEKHPEYLELADKIWWNGIVPSQRANGGFGTHSIPGKASRSPVRKDLIDECHWCCTMRGAEGLTFGAQATAFVDGEGGDTLTIAQFHEGEVTAKLESGVLKCRIETDYPQGNRVSVRILSAPQKPVTLRLFCPSYLEPDLAGGRWTYANSFCARTAVFTAGETLDFDFTQKTSVAQPVNAENALPTCVKRMRGPLVLGLEAVDWISDGKPVLEGPAAYGDDPAPVFSRTFTVDAPENAELAIACLGYYDVEINGRKLQASTLMPLWTVADRTIHEDAYPVGSLLYRGENTIRVTLGNGWYNPLPMTMFGRWNFRDYIATGRPKFRLTVRSADGVKLVGTDAAWQVAPTGILRNNVYLGTTVDARIGDAAREERWQAKVEPDPPGEVVRRMAPAIAPRDTAVAGEGRMLPKPWYDFWSDDRQIVDFGRNGSGVPTFNLGKGRRGEKIVIRYGESLHADGTLNTMSSVFGQVKWGNGAPGAPKVAEAVDTYIRSGEGEEMFTPPFTYHAFRYAEITGLKEPLPAGAATAEVHCSDLVSLVDFECSRADFNELHKVCRRTFLSNLVGVQSDCPGRERLGYGGDIAAMAETMALNFDMREFYLKTLRDFADDRAKHDGWYTETSPFIGIADRGFGGDSGSIAWTVAVPVMIDVLYRHYGDRRGLVYFDDLVDYLRKVDAKCPSGIVPQCIGDHETLDRNRKDNADTATIYYHEFVRLTERFAGLLGRDAEKAELARLREKIHAAFNTTFVKDGRVGKGTQGAQVLALEFGLIPQEQVAAAEKILFDDLEAHDGALTTGIFGTRALLVYLTRTGRADVASRIVTRKAFPGWLHMLDNGATTLWESWKYEPDFHSLDHPMFGSVDGWLLTTLLGITVGDNGEVTINPQPVAGVTWVKGSVRLPSGEIRKVEWHR